MRPNCCILLNRHSVEKAFTLAGRYRPEMLFSLTCRAFLLHLRAAAIAFHRASNRFDVAGERESDCPRHEP